MPRDASITLDDVRTYVREIRTRGARPTARAVHKQHGSGSMTTILRLLHEVFAEEACAGGGLAGALPEGVAKVFNDFVKTEVANAKAGLERQLEELKADAAASAEALDQQAETIAELERSAETTAKENSRMEGRIDQLTTELETARRKVDDHRANAEGLRMQVAIATSKLADVQQLKAELGDARLQLQRHLDRQQQFMREVWAQREQRVAPGG